MSETAADGYVESDDPLYSWTDTSGRWFFRREATGGQGAGGTLESALADLRANERYLHDLALLGLHGVE